MLERATLLLRPWQLDAAGLAWRCWVIDPSSTELLGSAVHDRRRRGWLGWLRRPCISIHESDDEPLLMTLRHRFGLWSAWSVRDAEGLLVGRVRGDRLLDYQGKPLAVLKPTSEGAVYRGGQGELAYVEREAEAVRVTFQMGEGGNPFLKMILLAATLVHNRDLLWCEEPGQSVSRGSLAASR